MAPHPMIFTVLAFQLYEGKRRVRMHYVAAHTSAEAQARITQENLSHLTGQCFITTDEHEAAAGGGCKLYISEYRSEEVSDADLRSWMHRMARPSSDGSDTYPAAFRRFHVAGNRSRTVAEAADLAA